MAHLRSTTYSRADGYFFAPSNHVFSQEPSLLVLELELSKPAKEGANKAWNKARLYCRPPSIPILNTRLALDIPNHDLTSSSFEATFRRHHRDIVSQRFDVCTVPLKTDETANLTGTMFD